MALNTISDITTEVLVRGQQNTASGHITDTMLNNWLKEKHRWAASFKKWPFTEGRASTTYASLITDEDGELRGEYPENWKPDSIRLMWIGGKRVNKIQYQQYKDFRETYPDDSEKIFTDFKLNYYVNPKSEVSGTITVWGQYTPIDLDTTDDTATTIFSNHEEDGNEAIVEAMLSEMEQRSNNPQKAQSHLQKAVALLSGIWDRFQDEQHGYQGKDPGMFEYFDLLQGGVQDGQIHKNRFY